MERMFVNLDRYGNTSAASVPIALAEAVDEGRVKVGDRIVLVAFGAGFTVRRRRHRVDGRPGARHRRRRAVRPEDVSVRLPVDWDSVDPIPDGPGRDDGPAGPGRRAARRRRARRTGAAATSEEVARMIDLTGKAAARHRRLARHRAGDRAAPRDAGRRRRVHVPRQRGRRGRDRRDRRGARPPRARDPGATSRDPEAAEALVKAALEAFGKVDILVNNAGITRDDLIMRMTDEAWREVLETNLFGAF